MKSVDTKLALNRLLEFAGKAFVVSMLLATTAHAEVKMSIWGHTAEGVAVPIYTLTSGNIEVRVMAYGARLVSVRTPDRTGKMADVVLGYDTLQGYLNDPGTRFGAVVGRYGNRNALGRFRLTEKPTRFLQMMAVMRYMAGLSASTVTFGRHTRCRTAWSLRTSARMETWGSPEP